MVRYVFKHLTSHDQSFEYEVKKNEVLNLVLFANETADYTARIRLVEPESSANIYGIILGEGTGEVHLKTFQEHVSPHTTSNLLVKSALMGRSIFTYEGTIVVHKDAQLTDAYQRNENLMLSSEAKAETKPALEILANDVRCTHSATIGKIDNEQLFYLMSRGVDAFLAQQLIVEGFFAPLLEKIMDQKIKAQLENEISSLVGLTRSQMVQ